MRPRLTSTPPLRLRSRIALVLLPVMLATAFLAGTWQRDDQPEAVEAAIVNLDEGGKVGGKHVPLGRQLSAALVDSDRTQNYSWVLADEAKAEAGLTDGRYAAVVTIPKTFTAAATSYSKNDATAHRATISVETSQTAGITDVALSRIVADEAVKTVNATLTEGYLKNIYLGFNKSADQMAELADGVEKIADATGKLDSGLQTLGDKGDELATGLARLPEATGTLSAGLSTMSRSTAPLPHRTAQLAQGTKRYVDAVNGMLAKMSGLTATGRPGVTDPSALTAAADGLASGLTRYQQKLVSIAEGNVAPSAGAAGCPEEIQREHGPRGCAGYAAGVRSAARMAADGLGTQQGKPGLLATARQLDQAAGRLATSFKGMPQLDPALAAGIPKLKGAGEQLVEGTSGLAASMPKLTQGLASTAGGAEKLNVAAGKTADGVRRYTQGVTKAADGSDKIARNVATLSGNLTKKAEKLPDYSRKDREALSVAVASPVATDNLNGLVAPTTSWAALLLVVAMWVGSLATYLVAPAVRRGTVTSSAATTKLLVQSLLPGLAVSQVQALALTAVAWHFLELDAGSALRLGVLLLLSGAVFSVVHFALAAWLGGAGRLVAVGLAVATAVAALTASVPPLAHTVAAAAPLAPLLTAVKALLAGGTGVAAGAVGAVLWLLAGLLGAAIALVRARSVSLAEVAALD